MRERTASIILFVLLAALVAVLPVQAKKKVPLPAANPAEYAPFQASGTSSLHGQAFLMTQGGDSKKAAGKEVVLFPSTSLSRAWWSRGLKWGNQFKEPPSDPLFLATWRTTTADADGRFHFKDLAPGCYLVRTKIIWKVPGAKSWEWEGGWTGRAVLVNGETDAIFSTMAHREGPEC